MIDELSHPVIREYSFSAGSDLAFPSSPFDFFAAFSSFPTIDCVTIAASRFRSLFDPAFATRLEELLTSWLNLQDLPNLHDPFFAKNRQVGFFPLPPFRFSACFFTQSGAES